MFERTFRVKYITSKDCFVYLSDKHSKSVNQGNIVKLSSIRNEPLYVSVGSHLTTLKEEEIAIGSMYARSLGIWEGDDAVISLCNNLPAIQRLDVIPETIDDFLVLESMAEIVQQTLLDQIRIVNNNQKVLIWISNSLHVVVNVDNIDPAAPGRLEELTEVVLKPPPVKQTEKSSNSSPWRMNGFWKYFGFDETPKSQLFDRFGKLHAPLVFRLQPVDGVKSKIPHFNAMAFFKVYVDVKSLPTNYFKSEIFSLRVIPLLVEHNFLDETNPLPESVAVQVCPIENLLPEHSVNSIPLFVNKSLFKHYNVNVGTKVILDKFNEATDISSIEIGASQQELSEVQRKFKEFVADNCKSEKLLLNSNFALDLSDDCKVQLKFAPSNVKACLVDGDFVRNCEFVTFECDFIENTAESVSPDTFCANFCNFESILRDCMRCWAINSTGCDGELQNILIVGKAGTGKTTLANNFAVSISSYHHVHVETVACKNIKGKSLDSLHKLFTNTFAKLIYYQPSMLVLDDLHVICEKVSDGDAPTQESIYFNKVSDLLADMLAPLLRNNFISVMATAETTIKLNQGVFSSRGKHFFKNVFSIDELNTGDRKTFIEFTFSQRMAELDGVDLQELAAKTEGFVAQDIVDLVDKCVFEAYKEESLKLTSSHCEKALHKTSSLSLRNVRLHSPGDRDFSNIGGLEDVKRTLVECMLWPAQYTNIFGKAPLRLQTGILLYGPPGTGKTILAGAAAKQCGLRLISVKGPELLSKYIGASEQAVRDVFQKAQSAKPCILFFDEFDSLAPRRGHDNTGVTDRVVNQFLTQLDGVEALIGVCVLAATSRPDLLDPALLRPGRLDRQIFCPLPDKEARLAILERLSSMLSLTDDVDLVEIAGETEGFSGADLQGVLYTAQLASVEHLLDENAAELESQARINQGHLIEAVRNTRPSLTNQEKIKYERIYAKFQGRGQLTDIMTGKQRATLA